MQALAFLESEGLTGTVITWAMVLTRCISMRLCLLLNTAR